MRALVGAVVCLIVATLLVAVLGVPLKHYAYLGTLAGGIAAGLLMRSLAGGGGSPYGKGALAALATGLAAVLGPLLAQQWYLTQRTKTPENVAKAHAVVTQEDDRNESAENDPETDTEDSDEPVTERSVRSPGAQVAYTPRKKDLSTPEVVCMALGCLAAYQLGKGSSAGPAADGHEGGEGTPPDDEPADETQHA